MKNKKVTILTICVVLLLIALIGISVFCIHLINKENAGTKEVISSGEDTETDTSANQEPSTDTTETLHRKLLRNPHPNLRRSLHLRHLQLT